MLITLKIIGDARGYREISFRKPGEYIVGRVDSVPCMVDDGRVSKQHCAIIIQPPEMKVKDLLSANGTIVDEVPLGAAAEPGADGQPNARREVPIKNGSVIQVGSTKIHVDIGMAPEDEGKVARWMIEGEKRLQESAEYFKHILETDPSNAKALATLKVIEAALQTLSDK